MTKFSTMAPRGLFVMEARLLYSPSKRKETICNLFPLNKNVITSKTQTQNLVTLILQQLFSI